MTVLVAGDAMEIVAVKELAADGWEDPPRRLPEKTAPVLSVEGFEGPLDWLLEMARTRKLDLARLSILALVEAFGEAMDLELIPGAPVTELTRWATWTVMAAQLAELRSRLMLPADAPGAQAARDEAEGLRQRWISHAEMTVVADWLERRPQLGRDVFARGQAEVAWTGQGAGRPFGVTAYNDVADDAELLEDAGRDDLTALLRACLVSLRLPSHTDTYQLRRLPFWTVADALGRITRLLPAQNESVSLDWFLPEDRTGEAGTHQPLRRKAALAATLIAGLELARGGSLTLDQKTHWQPILVDVEVA